MEAASVGEILQGLWRFESVHPEWTEHEGGEEGWEPSVAWWALAGASGLVLIDPLVFDWPALDRLVEDRGGCAGIVRTCHWHQRSIADAATRYGAAVWAKPPTDDTGPRRNLTPTVDNPQPRVKTPTQVTRLHRFPDALSTLRRSTHIDGRGCRRRDVAAPASRMARHRLSGRTSGMSG